MHQDKHILIALSAESVTDCRKAYGLASTSCKLRDNAIVHTQLCNDVVDEVLLIGA